MRWSNIDELSLTLQTFVFIQKKEKESKSSIDEVPWNIVGINLSNIPSLRPIYQVKRDIKF